MILIVEDDEDIRRNLVRVLGAEGYETCEAANGQIALETLARLAHADLPSCILLDLMMPVMDGSAFLIALHRHHREWTNIPIILNTAKGGVRLPSDDLPGALERLQKPVDIEQLCDAVARYASPG